MMLAISNHFVGRLLLHTILRWFCTAKDEDRLSPAENPGKAYRGGDCRRHGEHQRFIDRDGDVFLGILTWRCTNKVGHTPRPTDTEKKSASTTSITSLAWYTRLWNLIQCAWLKFEAYGWAQSSCDTKRIQLRQLQCEADFFWRRRSHSSYRCSLSVCVEQRILTIEFQKRRWVARRIKSYPNRIGAELAQDLAHP